MLIGFKCKYFDASEANFPAALFNLLAVVLHIVSNSQDSYIHQLAVLWAFKKHVTIYFAVNKNCRIGIRHFWHSAKFGSFVDVGGNHHTTYHFDGKVLVDCITPLIANLFYILIAFCFVVVVKSTLACILSIMSLQAGFTLWLRRNAILEISSMILAILACIIALFVGLLVHSANSFSHVTAGTGSILIILSGTSSLFAAAAGLRRTYRIARQRRAENQRIMCSRSLRSWRELGRRPEDMRPIIDFERYLDSSWTAPIGAP
ncbi:unnamed protein product [Thelazia callipaeda]|uniref:TMEM127 domain-containing protein n=1 Tax=Thelazia callipaeda TaxID=103827 RepID=A0A0N5CYQ5_THECL|nr:unnamed protein product [Thelazia callipaeda]